MEFSLKCPREGEKMTWGEVSHTQGYLSFAIGSLTSCAAVICVICDPARPQGPHSAILLHQADIPCHRLQGNLTSFISTNRGIAGNMHFVVTGAEAASLEQFIRIQVPQPAGFTTYIGIPPGAFISGPLRSSPRPQQGTDGWAIDRPTENAGRTTILPMRAVDHAKWKPDDDFSCCPICHVKFGFFTRKHHCRNCGNVVCDDCSKERRTLFGTAASDTRIGASLGGLHRVCKTCADQYA